MAQGWLLAGLTAGPGRPIVMATEPGRANAPWGWAEGPCAGNSKACVRPSTVRQHTVCRAPTSLIQRPTTGHIHGGDNAATTFTWEIFIKCGDPAVAAHDTYFAGYDQSQVSPISAPDNR